MNASTTRDAMKVEDIRVETTPNPTAWKFVLPGRVIAEGNRTFRNHEEAKDIPLADSLIRTGHVSQVYFFDDTITITQDGDIGWNILADVVCTKITDHFDKHDPASVTPDERGALDIADGEETVRLIDEILNETIRPALQMDGGDLQVLSYDSGSKTLRISYQGACGSCPSAIGGTMMAIQTILQESVDTGIRVVTA
jgi:NFU1 iron-sulfur cluster scaffold homolog, mitochondrial